MEPRSIERGEKDGRRQWKESRNCFNGATFNRTWREAGSRDQIPITGASMEPRSIERGEERLADTAGRRVARASMEPRSIERGEGPRQRSGLTSTTTLQWSHVQSNVES